MAVTFDSAFANLHTGATVQTQSFGANAGSNTSGSVGANANRILIGVVAANAVQASMGTVTLTWDAGGTNQAMTLITSSDVGTFGSVYIFGLKAPATGALSLQTTWSGAATGIDLVWGAISLFNCDQTTGWNNSGTDTGTGTNAASSVTTTSGDMAVVGHYNENATSTTINAGTAAWTETGANGNSGQGYRAASGASTSVGWTLGSSVAWANVKVNVIQLGGGGGGGAKKRMLAGLLAQRALRV